MFDYQAYARAKLAEHGIYPPKGVITAFTFNPATSDGLYVVDVYFHQQEFSYTRSIEDIGKCRA